MDSLRENEGERTDCIWNTRLAHFCSEGFGSMPSLPTHELAVARLVVPVKDVVILVSFAHEQAEQGRVWLQVAGSAEAERMMLGKSEGMVIIAARKLCQWARDSRSSRCAGSIVHT
jgi:hypothetical protein